MKKFSIYLLIVLAILSLSLYGCGDKKGTELPPPSYQPPTGGDSGVNPGDDSGDDSGDDPSGDEDPDGTGIIDPHPGSWDANRGKVVTPSGTGWTSKVIAEGITYYTYTSTQDATTGVCEQVFAIDLDLNNPNYQVKLTYNSASPYTSDVFSSNNAIVAMNAGYEKGSIFIRTKGTINSNLPNVTIGDTGVPNWKSEGAFVCDGSQAIKLLYIGSSKRNALVKDIAGGTVADAVRKQRSYCTSLSVAKFPYVLTSAPMLVYDYEPVGENFADYSLTSAQVNKLNSEDPDRHQRVRHPRTAVALTENNHFIMFVVDGRYDSYSKGMSCRELTRFMVKHFNPQFALNLDGGGSSTLCVQGEGDANTHVVNYPCDNATNGVPHDHSGQRARDTHIIIVRK